MQVTATDWLIVAVVIDSAVTMFVGWRLNRTAKRHVASAAESVKPAINDSISAALAQAIPIVLRLLEEKVNAGNSGPKSDSGRTTIPITESKRQFHNVSSESRS